MSQIQKFKLGSTIGDYNQAKLEYEKAYANADADTKAWLDGFMQSSANYTAADAMNGRSQREYLTLVYSIGKLMAELGKAGYVTPGAAPAASTKNVFNGYSHNENINNANEVNRKYINQNQSASTTSGSNAALTGKHYTWKWDRNWNTGWGQLAALDLNTKLLNFANNLKSNLDQLNASYEAGYTLHGASPESMGKFNQARANLETFISNVSSGAYAGKDMDAIRALASIAETVNVDPDAFMSYFESNLPKDSELDKRRKALEAQGYSTVSATDLGYNPEIANYLAKNKINLMRLNGSDDIYAFNDLYSGFAPLKYINTDWRLRGQENSPYNWGIFTDENGKIWTGNYDTDLTNDNPLYDAITQYRNSIIDNRGKLFLAYNNFNPNLNYTGDSKTISDFISGQGAAAGLKSRNNFVDVSQLFKGNKQIIAVNPDGSAFNTEGLADGTLEFSPDTLLFYLGDDNTLHSVSWNDPQIESVLGQYNPDGWNETSNQIGSKLKGLNLDLNSTTITADLIKDPQEWANRMLTILTKSSTLRTRDEIKELEKYNGFSNKENILAYIGSLLQEGSITLDLNLKNKWDNLTKEYRTDELNVTHSGLTDEERDIKLLDEAHKAGYSNVSDYLGSLRKGFSTAEWMRLSALAADIASLGASFAPGAGTIASGILGAGASGTEFAADIVDDGFQWRDLGQLGINLGLDVVGLLPGGKSLKITKNAVKVISRSLPMLIGLWSAMANGDKYINVATKLAHGDVKDMTALDWQTLGHGLMLVTGGVRTFKATSGAYKLAGNAIKTGTLKAYNAVKEPIMRNKTAPERAKNIAKIKEYAPLQKQFNAEVTRENVSGELNNRASSSSNNKAYQSVSKEALALAETKAVVPIKNKENFKQFLLLLRKNNPNNYNSMLGNKRFMELSKQQYDFKQGGQLDRFSEYLKSHK